MPIVERHDVHHAARFATNKVCGAQLPQGDPNHPTPLSLYNFITLTLMGALTLTLMGALTLTLMGAHLADLV